MKQEQKVKELKSKMDLRYIKRTKSQLDGGTDHGDRVIIVIVIRNFFFFMNTQRSKKVNMQITKK